jgi:hypothetical protein
MSEFRFKTEDAYPLRTIKGADPADDRRHARTRRRPGAGTLGLRFGLLERALAPVSEFCYWGR